MLVTTTHLEQTAPEQLVPGSQPLPHNARVEQVVDISPEFSRFLYQCVGSGWNWTDRLPLARSQWDAILRTPGAETWVLWLDGAPAGYIELMGRPGPAGSDVEILYFGLFPEFLGRGLGGALLAEGIQQAWQLDRRWPGFQPVSRVWVHTCSLDGPAALANYQARGMTVFKTEEEDIEPQDASTGLWPAEQP
ncbi:GNAT family acetyltransferase [Arthrobacter crystallopoietes BAB-32]|uniref:GNAT family acetyltransferase n=1 Tax=Arthrobacter crystallopoietes BAB-32 TaxID=1246476 RepID=N1V378_9MICC|nr:GNAT family N-acetyltransferase [Arthrobacter crystallopoietes]EMY34527.1 GNAT family acetyltransferase [Arthrobacter crystallopoietes BAB-32]